MKKKFLAFGLAAAMVLGSAFSAFAGTVPSLDIDAGFSANTGDEAVSGNFDVSYEFHNASQDTSQNYFNFIVEVTGDGFGITARADAFAWNFPGVSHEAAFSWTGQPNWDEFRVAMTDADVVVNIKRTAENTITLKYDITAGDKVYAITGEVIADAIPENLNVHITGEKVKLSDITFKVNEDDPAGDDPTGEDPTIKNSPQGGDEDVSKPGTGNEDPTKPSTGNEDPTKPGLGGPGDDEEQTVPSPDGGNEETVITVTVEAAKAVAEAAVVTSNDGKVLDVELVVTPVDDAVAAAVAGMVEADEALSKAGVKALAVLDLELMVGGKNVTLLDNKINVTIPMDKIFEDIAADAFVAVYRVDNDALSFLGTSKVAADKTITFATDHFSQYVFAVVDDAEALKDVKVVEYVKDIDTTATPDVSVADIPVKADASVNDPNKTGDTTPVMPLVVLAVIALGGVLAVVASKKRA